MTSLSLWFSVLEGLVLNSHMRSDRGDRAGCRVDTKGLHVSKQPQPGVGIEEDLGMILTCSSQVSFPGVQQN